MGEQVAAPDFLGKMPKGFYIYIIEILLILHIENRISNINLKLKNPKTK